MRVMRIDYSYPENIGKIVGELEDQLIGLHGKIGFKIQEQNLSIKKSQEKAEEDKSISQYTLFNVYFYTTWFFGIKNE